MSDWYPCWSSGLRLEAFTQTGWSRSHDGHTTFNVTGTSCWWTPGQSSCKEYSARTHGDDGNAVVPDSWTAGATTHAYDAHDTNSAKQWRRYYDQQTADIVYQMYKEDFDAFGYPRLVL